MGIDKSTIDKAINEFERHNDLKISDYELSSPTKRIRPYRDSHIAEEVFYDYIEEWLKACNDDSLRRELLRLLGQYNYFTFERYTDDFFKLITSILDKECLDISQVLFGEPFQVVLYFVRNISLHIFQSWFDFVFLV